MNRNISTSLSSINRDFRDPPCATSTSHTRTTCHIFSSPRSCFHKRSRLKRGVEVGGWGEGQWAGSTCRCQLESTHKCITSQTGCGRQDSAASVMMPLDLARDVRPGCKIQFGNFPRRSRSINPGLLFTADIFSTKAEHAVLFQKSAFHHSVPFLETVVNTKVRIKSKISSVLILNIPSDWPSTGPIRKGRQKKWEHQPGSSPDKRGKETLWGYHFK